MVEKEWIDYYALLELYNPIARTGKGPNSTPKEIKTACREQQYVWHPDRFKEGTGAWRKANERSKLINEACRLLSDLEQKKAYDREWLKRNPWFEDKDRKTSSAPPEIAVEWDPPDVQSGLFYNIPRGERRRAKLHVKPRVGEGFTVEILEPKSGWLRIVEPVSRRGIPPFTAVVEIDTSGLQYDEPYSDELIFVVEEP